jgi:kynurenine formamidase
VLGHNLRFNVDEMLANVQSYHSGELVVTGHIVYSQAIHLSHIIDPEIPRWDGDPPVRFETVANLAADGYFLRQFAIGEHSATHMNAPRSFDTRGAGIDGYGANSLVVEAIVIDFRDRASVYADATLSIDEVRDWERQHDRIPAGSVVLLYCGWQEKWSNPSAFMNDMHFPGFAAETTQFLLEQRQIAGVGIDTHGVDGGGDTTFATNRQVLQRGGIVLENLTNLDRLPATGATLVIGILRLRGGSGSPVSAIALVP